MDTSARSLSDMGPEEIRDAVFDRYGCVAESPGESHGFPVGREFAEAVGYDPAELDALPAACAASFTGAGNPQAAVDLGPKEKLLDIGCGAGLDLCLYARRFGTPERLAGLDGSRSMVATATENLADAGFEGTEVFCTRAETIPLPAEHLDVVTANGIFNLSPDEHQAYVGKSAFAHKGGIHVAAMRRNIHSYQHVNPELVGNEMRTVQFDERNAFGAEQQRTFADTVAHHLFAGKVGKQLLRDPAHPCLIIQRGMAELPEADKAGKRKDRDKRPDQRPPAHAPAESDSSKGRIEERSYPAPAAFATIASGSPPAFALASAQRLAERVPDRQ